MNNKYYQFTDIVIDIIFKRIHIIYGYLYVTIKILVSYMYLNLIEFFIITQVS